MNNHPWAKAFNAKLALIKAKKEARIRKRRKRAKELYDEVAKLRARYKYRREHGIPLDAPLQH